MSSNTQSSTDYPKPAVRRLRIYAFDPHASVELNTAVINDATIQLPWETRWEAPLEIGPVNDYLEVIDHDPASGVFYAPVDLNDPILLAQDGLPPSEGRPQFHQQMVFAVAMRTIRSFERALGRGVLWASSFQQDQRGEPGSPGRAKGEQHSDDELKRAFTRRLRIYPHALREANAYYSPEKCALLFGYFRPEDHANEVDASWVFTCLSQDIIAHETTHAILHGLQRRSIEPSNIDALAFHEAFADIVALLQHFGMSDVLRHQLGQSRGSLRAQGLLTGLAQQFGRATGRNGALRYALGLLQHDAIERDRQREKSTAGRPASPETPDGSDESDAPKSLNQTTEPHARGGFLVAAIFDAFVTIYERRTSDLLRIARVQPGTRSVEGDLTLDLVTRLASEASKAADHVLRICVRALDYIPPVDLRFGEYLRAIITADHDLVPDDPMRYRIAFVEAFRKRGITVPGCISMAPDSLLWSAPDPREYSAMVPQEHDQTGNRTDHLEEADDPDPLSRIFVGLLKDLQLSIAFDGTRRKLGKGDCLVAFEETDFDNRRSLRELSMRIVLYNQSKIRAWFNEETPEDELWEQVLGMRLLPAQHPNRGRHRTAPLEPMGSITTQDDRSGKPTDMPSFQVNSARISRRAGPNGEELHQLIIQMMQERRGYFDEGEQDAAERGDIEAIGKERWDSPDFWFRGGATIHVDLRDGRLMRIIRKRIDNKQRLDEERRFRRGDAAAAAMTGRSGEEPFAFMHGGAA